MSLEQMTPQGEEANITTEDTKVAYASHAALPATVSDLIAARKSKQHWTLNDQVEQVHMKLYEDPDYKDLIDAVHNSQAVEGSLRADDHEAARAIRTHAKNNGLVYLAEQNLHTLMMALSVVLRRYGISRKERREA